MSRLYGYGVTGASSGIPAPLSENVPVHWRQPGIRLDERATLAAEAIFKAGIADRNLLAQASPTYKETLKKRLTYVRTPPAGQEGWLARHSKWTTPSSYLTNMIKSKSRNSPDAQRRARLEIMSAEQFVVNASAGRNDFNETGFRRSAPAPGAAPAAPLLPQSLPGSNGGWVKWALYGGAGFIALISFLLILKGRRS